MTIPSMTFIAFVILSALIYYMLPFQWMRKTVLILSSLFFYASFRIEDVMYLFGVIFFSYFMSHLFEVKRNPLTLCAAVLPLIFGLAYYKYSSFFLSNSVVHIAPVGISFFTFKALAYLGDVYSNKQSAEESFIHVFIYISFFPQILSGPIQKPSSFFYQINKKLHFDYPIVRSGFLLVFFGMIEKMLVADRLLQVVDLCFIKMDSLNFSSALIGCIAYSLQIYADFDSYSNIAIGLTQMFGFRCEQNFSAPYFSRNLKEFWSRWHISLSTWFKEYIYIPLGGNRKGLFRKYLHLLVVFLISGLWHGAAWNYVLWGLLHGVIQIGEDLFGRIIKLIKLDSKIVSVFTFLPRILINFLIVSLLWIIFKFESIEEILAVFHALKQFDFQNFSFSVIGLAQEELTVTAVFCFIFVMIDLLRYTGFSIHSFGKLIFPIRWVVYVVTIALAIVFAFYGSGYDPSRFIYIQF